MKKIFLLLSLVLSTFQVTAKETEFTIMHGPGGVSDIVTRFIASEMNNNYIPTNRPGGGGIPAISHLMREETLMLATMVQVFVTNPINHQNLIYNPKEDLEVVATIGIMPSALVCNNKTGFKSYSDFQNSKNAVSFGFGGWGSNEHIATEILLFKNKQIDATLVPYATGGNRAVTDLVGGHIDCMFANLPTIRSQLTNENLIILLTSHEVGLKVPTWEGIYQQSFPFQGYLSVIIPKKMSADKKEMIRKDLGRSFLNLNYKSRLAELGLFPVPSINEKDITRSLQEMDSIRKFLLTNNIKTSDK